MSEILQKSEKATGELTAYTYEEVLEAATEYFEGDSLAATVWVAKYALKDAEGNIYELTPDDMHRRLAKEFARIEAKYPDAMDEEEIFNLIKDFKYIVPQGSPMSGIGNNLQKVSIGNCFVVGNPEGMGDSYGAILRTDERIAQLQKRRAGVGTDLSDIRPAGTAVANAAITSTGIVPFMERHSNTTREVAQGGRRGALMLSCSIRHPEAEAFIDAKMDSTKVTGANVSVKIHDDFMNAVLAGEQYKQQWPINSPNPKMTQMIDASALWKKLVHNNHSSAEPGILFWDKIISESPADCYSHLGFRTTSTNPCLTGDTLVALADGRGDISIKELAETGMDVPVLCLDAKNKLTVKMMRNPRITGHNQKIFKVLLDDGSEFKVTENHAFKGRDGIYIPVSDMKPGQQLLPTWRWDASIKDVFPNANANSQNYKWYTVGESNKLKSEHRLFYENLCGPIPKGYVVHHVDYDSSNNTLDNLRIMTKQEHDNLHAKDMLGDKNPRYSHFTIDQIISSAVDLCIQLNRRFSKSEWIAHAKTMGMPVGFSKYRNDQGLESYTDFSMMSADLAGLSDQNYDPRILKTQMSALLNGYEPVIIDNSVKVKKCCENCENEFLTRYEHREVSFCGTTCSNNYLNKNTDVNVRRTNTINKTYSILGKKKREAQLNIYSELKFKLGRQPSLNEFTTDCKSNNISGRLSTKYGFTNYTDLKEIADRYNHRLVSVEFVGYEDVYNGTVDDHHNFFIVGNDSTSKFDKKQTLLINNRQCGELPLPPGDSCRLLVQNLYSYVINPFRPNAKFDFELFKEHTMKAQRLMDDLIDLELEKIDAIIAKIIEDPESVEIKENELAMWREVREKCENGRRTGTGITAEGDMIAALGLTYGTKKATTFAEKVQKELAINAYKSSCYMARDRGTFPIYDAAVETENPFLNRLKDADPELKMLMDKYGRRNIAILTIAPAGSVSILTKTTSGIECAFMVAYKRRRKVNPNDKNVTVAYIDQNGDSWEEFMVYHHHFKTWMLYNGIDPVKVSQMSTDELNEVIAQSPYHNAMSNDVDWVEKVKMQGAMQKWIDHSISVTVNLPNEATEELVHDVYVAAWKAGCKGCTIYRDGSRSGVLISLDEKEDNTTTKKDNHAPKRPKHLDCDVLRFMNKGEKWIGFVGLMDGRPYEVFTGKADAIPVPHSCETGRVRKTKVDGEMNGEKCKVSKYDFVYTDHTGAEVVCEWLNTTFNEEYFNYAKLISGILRHKMPLPSVVSVIQGLNIDDEVISTWKGGVARMIKKYIEDGTEVSNKECKECGMDSLVYQDGCVSCSNCGNSRC